ncbi:hypothetical protein ACTPOK_13730 [Streptomyces inhibens]|uniref:hypothetical protein n=1 Tax=Streptomyces inhibens TaxID=2293571 RepID=UPI00402A8DE5
MIPNKLRTVRSCGRPPLRVVCPSRTKTTRGINGGVCECPSLDGPQLPMPSDPLPPPPMGSSIRRARSAFRCGSSAGRCRESPQRAASSPVHGGNPAFVKGREELKQDIRGSRAVIVPSHTEGFGLVGLEAIEQAGLPRPGV